MKYLMIIMLLCIFISPAFAYQPLPEEAATNIVANSTAEVASGLKENLVTWWQVLLKHFIELMFFIITMMATAFFRVLGKKYKFDEYTNKINDVLARATGYAEQKALTMAKVQGKPMPSAEKMALAIKFAEELAKDYKLTNKGEAWWSNKLESWLGVGKEN